MVCQYGDVSWFARRCCALAQSIGVVGAHCRGRHSWSPRWRCSARRCAARSSMKARPSLLHSCRQANPLCTQLFSMGISALNTLQQAGSLTRPAASALLHLYFKHEPFADCTVQICHAIIPGRSALDGLVRQWTEHPVVKAMCGVQEYMVKLLGRYREFVERDVPGSPGPAAGLEANGAGPRSRHQDDGYIRQLLTPAHLSCGRLYSLRIRPSASKCAICDAGVHCLMKSRCHVIIRKPAGLSCHSFVIDLVAVRSVGQCPDA